MNNKKTPWGDLVEKFPLGMRVVHLNRQFGRVVDHRVVDHRGMADRSGLYPVILFDDGVLRFSSPAWGLRGIENPIDRLFLLIHERQPHCSIRQEGHQVYISTPGGEFQICPATKKLLPEIPSPRHKALSAIIAEVWKVQCVRSDYGGH